MGWFRKNKHRTGSGGTVFLTGAARGIGRATAFALVKRGYKVGLVDRDEDLLKTVSEELSGIGGAVVARPADVCESESLKSAVHDVEEAIGPIENVIACAGVGHLASVLDMNLEGFRLMLDVNVLGVARTIEAVLPGMFARKRGHIVGISSVAGFRGMPWMPGYSASKAALTTYLEALRPALKIRGVTVTTLYPGFVRTGMTIETPFRRPMPMLEPEEAARYIVHAVETRPRDYIFPASARLGMGFLRRLPPRAFDYCMDKAGPEALTTPF